MLRGRRRRTVEHAGVEIFAFAESHHHELAGLQSWSREDRHALIPLTSDFPGGSQPGEESAGRPIDLGDGAGADAPLGEKRHDGVGLDRFGPRGRIGDDANGGAAGTEVGKFVGHGPLLASVD